MKMITIKADSRLKLIMTTESGKTVEHKIDIIDLDYIFNYNWAEVFYNGEETDFSKTIFRNKDEIASNIMDYEYDHMNDYVNNLNISPDCIDYPTAIVGAVVSHYGDNMEIVEQKFYWGD